MMMVPAFGGRGGFAKRRRRFPKKRFSRRRFGGRFPNRMVRSTIVRQLSPEVKRITDGDLNPNIDDAAVLNLNLSRIAQDDGAGNRIGRQVDPISIQWRYQLKGQTPGDYVVNCTVILAQFKSSITSGASPRIADILINPTDAYSGLVQNVNKTWRILHRGYFVLCDLGKQNSFVTTGSQIVNIARKRLLRITYTGTGLDSVDTGQINVFVVSEVPAAQAAGVMLDWAYKMSYMDM